MEGCSSNGACAINWNYTDDVLHQMVLLYRKVVLQIFLIHQSIQHLLCLQMKPNSISYIITKDSLFEYVFNSSGDAY